MSWSCLRKSIASLSSRTTPISGYIFPIPSQRFRSSGISRSFSAALMRSGEPINGVSVRNSRSRIWSMLHTSRLGFVDLQSRSIVCFSRDVRWYSSQSARASRMQQPGQEGSSRSTLLYLSALVVAMLGASYAAVPLYRTFCQATGYGGTVQRRETVEEKIARHTKEGTTASREIVVQFNADVADGMPWKFTPTQREVKVKPGESALAFYTVENISSKPITGVSTYNVTPMKAAVYFNKIQCFCFEEQRLLPGEQIDMPVFFYIDPEFETDQKMDGINNLILSYTFFKVNE